MARSVFLRRTAKIILISAVATLAACGNFIFTGTPPVDFGDVLVFTTSAPRDLTWRNIGDAHEIDGGTADRPFAVQSSFTSVTVPTGGTVTLQYFFKPTALGPATGNAKLTNLLFRPQKQDVAVKGNGVAYISDGNITIINSTGGGAPTQAIDFGQVQKGTASAPRVIMISNTTPAGAAPAPIAVTVKWSRNNQGFTSTPAQGTTFVIPPSGVMPVPVVFTPPDVGVYEDSVVFAATVGGRHIAGIMVKGQGVPRQE